LGDSGDAWNLSVFGDIKALDYAPLGLLGSYRYHVTPSAMRGVSDMAPLWGETGIILRYFFLNSGVA